MDYRKIIQDKQKEFLSNPRQNIQNLVAQQKSTVKELIQLPQFRQRPDLLKLFGKFHLEYGQLIGKLFSLRIINASMFRDDTESIILIQRIKEQAKVLNNYKAQKVVDESIALSLFRVYASALELLWGKVKNIVFFAGLNPKKRHLKIPELIPKIVILEQKYKVNLSLIKSTLNSELRNCVNHETAYFEPPNMLVFLEKKGGDFKEIARHTTDEIYEEIMNTTIILMAFVEVENTVIISSLIPLLKLDDVELGEYIKTGKLTEKMQKKMGFIK